MLVQDDDFFPGNILIKRAALANDSTYCLTISITGSPYHAVYKHVLQINMIHKALIKK